MWRATNWNAFKNCSLYFSRCCSSSPNGWSTYTVFNAYSASNASIVISCCTVSSKKRGKTHFNCILACNWYLSRLGMSWEDQYLAKIHQTLTFIHQTKRCRPVKGSSIMIISIQGNTSILSEHFNGIHPKGITMLSLYTTQTRHLHSYVQRQRLFKLLMHTGSMIQQQYHGHDTYICTYMSAGIYHSSHLRL